MKMVKKVLMGLALGAAVFSFVGCADLLNGLDKKKDDENAAIKGSGANLTVSYANAGKDNYRAYKSTALKHAGALIKVTFNNDDVGKSKMGVIFDLSSDAEDKTARNFFIIGLNPRSDVANFYVSKFSNVTDIQADNFGTKLADNPAKEIEYVPLAITNNIKVPAKATDGSISYYVYYKLLTDGSFDWAVIEDLTDAEVKTFKGALGQNDSNFDAVNISTFGSRVLKSGNIPASDTGYEAAAGTESEFYNQNQKLIAYYAQIASGATLEGSWKFPNTAFHEAEDAE